MSENVAEATTETPTETSPTSDVTTGEGQTSSAEIAKMSEPSPNFSIPEEYAEKGWIKTIKSQDDLWKQMDAAQSMIGSRTEVPSAEASDEDWTNFYNKLGRPEEAAGYELPTQFEGMPEGADLTEQRDIAQNILHKAGLTKKQAGAVWSEFIKNEMGIASQNQEDYAKLASEMSAKHLGDNTEQITQATDDAIAKYLPEELHDGLAAAMSGNVHTQIAFAKLHAGMQAEIDAVKAEYGAEGSISKGNPSSAASVDETRQKLAKLRTSDAARNFDHPDHQKTVNEIQELSGRIQKMMG